MLVDFPILKCDIYPKAKYRLYINGTQHYYFVTTRYSEDECIDLMMEKVNSYSCAGDVSYKIVKVKNNIEYYLKKGRQ